MLKADGSQKQPEQINNKQKQEKLTIIFINPVKNPECNRAVPV